MIVNESDNFKQIEELRGELNAMEEKAARHEAEKLKNQKEVSAFSVQFPNFRGIFSGICYT